MYDCSGYCWCYVVVSAVCAAAVLAAGEVWAAADAGDSEADVGVDV